MVDLAGHARTLIAFNAWADNRILDACSGVTDEQYASIRAPLSHMLGTQRWWHARFIHNPAAFAEPDLLALAHARDAFAATHDDWRVFGEELDDAAWHRAEPWWREWGRQEEMMIGDVIVQVVNHSTQHRSEIAVVISGYGHSPGDVDYLVFLEMPC